MNKYDIVVIGAGAAGLIGARLAAKLGANVALVDRARIGGDCTWTGCIPSKSLIHVAKVAHSAKQGSKLGVHCDNVTLDWAQVMEFVNGTIADVYSHTTPELLTSEGIDVFLGETRFISPTSIEVAGHGTLTSKHFLIGVGAEPSIPPISGLAETPYLTYLNLFELKIQPKSLIVVGAGPIGLEMAQAFTRLGTEVTVIDEATFAREEPEVGKMMNNRLQLEGVTICIGRADLVRRTEGGVAVTVGSQEIHGEQLLVSTGRKPRLEGLNLEAAGVKYSAEGIEVDDSLHTSAKHIFAAGDCIGSFQFSHFAGWQAWQAVRTALLPGSGGGKAHVLPWCTFTDPEVARVGPLEAEARKTHGGALQVKTMYLKDVDRAICEDDQGFIKLLHVGNKIIGATVVAARAGELINEVALAMKQDIGLDKLAGTIHAYPTYSTALQLMASDIAHDTFFTGTLGKIALKISGLEAHPITP